MARLSNDRRRRIEENARSTVPVTADSVSLAVVAIRVSTTSPTSVTAAANEHTATRHKWRTGRARATTLSLVNRDQLPLRLSLDAAHSIVARTADRPNERPAAPTNCPDSGIPVLRSEAPSAQVLGVERANSGWSKASGWVGETNYDGRRAGGMERATQAGRAADSRVARSTPRADRQRTTIENRRHASARTIAVRQLISHETHQHQKTQHARQIRYSLAARSIARTAHPAIYPIKTPYSLRRRL
uniref:Uncharacterized protein n=1 Tax=Plectus sambesii TaxID=2011161 RepID=A0A914WUE7_9BILA